MFKSAKVCDLKITGNTARTGGMHDVQLPMAPDATLVLYKTCFRPELNKSQIAP